MNISRQTPGTKHFSRAAQETTGPPPQRVTSLLLLTFTSGVMEEANKLIGLGKKRLVMGKVVEAVSTLQEACGMLAKEYGDTADECGEAFYWCGKALLDLARMENSVLGNALQGVPEEEEDEEKPKDSNVEMESTESLDEKTRDELRVQVYDAMAEKKETTEKDDKKEDSTTEKADDAEEKPESTSDTIKDGATEKEKSPAKVEPTIAATQDAKSAATVEKAEENKSKSPLKDDSSKEAKEKDEPLAEKPSDSDENKENIAAETEIAEEKTENEPAEDDCDEDMEGDEEAEETGDEKADGEDTAEKGSDDEEVGNLQLAWEMLEVAKVIYKRKEAKEDQLMAAQTHLKLGEVSAESGNYTQAIEDFQECLKLQLTHLESDSRLLAETHYQLGLTYSLNCQYKQAIDELNSSICVIKSRLVKLQELIDKAEGLDSLPEERKEMEELKALLPEIQEKVEDATEGLKTASTDVEAVKGVLEGNTAAETDDKKTSTKANGKPSEQTTASDISHLVRKKRKPEESPVKEVKKVKQDEAQTTNGAEEPQPNGVQTNGHSKEKSTSLSTGKEVESN